MLGTNPMSLPDTPLTTPSCVAHIDLGAVRHNFTLLQKAHPAQKIAAVIKADAYGLGTAPIARSLALAGCQHFVVAFPEEGLFLRTVLKDAKIYVLSGAWEGMERTFVNEKLIPVLNDLESAKRWHSAAPGAPCALHVDTGMARTGFETHDLLQEKTFLETLNLQFIMSHYANSDDSHHPSNKAQHDLFDEIARHFPTIPTCLANSCALSLDDTYWGNFVRPGLKLYGLSPDTVQKDGYLPAVRVSTRILQVREITPGQNVGYGNTWAATRPTRLATLAMGYADGLLRTLSNKGHVWIQGQKAPLVGRVSMDFATIDVTDLDPAITAVGSWVDLFYDAKSLYEQAHAADTAPHEFLVGLSTRCTRLYTA
ncbi:MAG: alanine racemase [Alphaproteobacteria bacterium]|jgi:alanine racemase|nr:alanine racemase [Alphaproteobacteria bacterium]